MKRRYLVPVLLFPLLSGCYGNFITKDTAKVRIANIIDRLTNENSENYVKIEDYELPNYVLNNKYVIENYEQEKHAELNNDEHFYREYVIQKSRDKSTDDWTYSLTESWKYLKEEDNQYCFYHVTRLNGETNELGSPVYTANIDIYNKEENRGKAWDEFVLSKKNDIHASSVHVIEEVNGIIDLIEADNNIEVFYLLRSLNDDSIYIDATYVETIIENIEEKTLSHRFEISLENLRTAMYKHYINNGVQFDEQVVEYGARVDRLEPDLTYSTINKNYKDKE